MVGDSYELEKREGLEAGSEERMSMLPLAGRLHGMLSL
jgi:hypothetical protein